MFGSQHSLFPFCVPITGDDHLNTLSNPYPIPALTASTSDERLILKLIESTRKKPSPNYHQHCPMLIGTPHHQCGKTEN